MLLCRSDDALWTGPGGKHGRTVCSKARKDITAAVNNIMADQADERQPEDVAAEEDGLVNLD